ncbi:uncharacterized protein [Periplaneta americana]|uniref:uncharacterized protein n=1 Tax=Periplaneta americana TaxID=6978 RepID=UPI0037E91C2A
MAKTYTMTISQEGLIHLVEDGPIPPVVPGVFLVLNFSLGLCLNLVLVFTVITSPVLRRLSFNRILLHLCIACSLECFLNVTAAVAFLAVTHLDIESKFASELLLGCRINAALAQWTMAIQSAALAALAVDRIVTLRQQVDPKSVTTARLMRLLPALLWVYGTALVTPIVATTHIVAVRPFPDRYSCGVVQTSEDSTELVYPSLLLILGYIIPWIVILVIFAMILYHVISTRRRQIQQEEAILQRSQGRTSLVALSNSAQLLHSTSYQTSWSNWLGGSGPSSWEEVKFYFLSSILLLFYIILLVPHILCVNIPTLSTMPTPAAGTLEVSSANNTSKSSQPPELKPVLTGTYDCIFVWCRFIFTVAVPIIIFSIHKEVRTKCGHMFCCCFCRSNAVDHLDTARSISACVEKRTLASEQGVSNQVNKTNSRKRYLNKKDKYTRTAHYRTPVLFATSEGLHLRLVDDRLQDSYYLNDADIGAPGAAGGKEQCWTVEPRFLCEFCDVAIITSTPSESINNPANSLQHSYGASMRKSSKPPVFGEQSLAEEDLHVSDDLTGDSSGEFARKRNAAKNDVLVKKNNFNNRNVSINNRNVSINNRNVSINNRNVSLNNKKVPRVRFAQTVSEIPLSESGVWSSPEDQGLMEQSFVSKRNESQNIAPNSLKQKQNVNAIARGRIEKPS